MTFTNTAVTAAKEAGAYLLKNFAKTELPEKRMKSQFELVTEFDLEANTLIINTIKAKYPDHDILSEETGLANNPGKVKWVVDPLDGTTNFAIRNPVFAVSIGVMQDGKLIAGVVYAPVTDDLYVAEKGKGARLNGRKLHVSTTETLKSSIIMYGSSHDPHSAMFALKINEHFLNYVFKIRRLGSSALDLAFVAAGRVDACIIAPPIDLWGTAAGILLIQEAGGKITDLSGKKWVAPGDQVVASNGLLHSEILQHVKEIQKS